MDEATASTQTQTTATVTVPLSGSPLSGLRIIADGAETDCPADWTAEYAAGSATAAVGDRVVTTLLTPSRPLVTGLAVQGVSS